MLVHSGDKGTNLYVDTYFWSDPTNRYWTVEAQMYIKQTSGWNVGSWGDFGGSYINDVKFDGSIPYTTSGSTYTIKDWTLVSQGYYNDNGDAPTITINWKWGVNSSWGGCVYPSSSFTITGTSISPKIVKPVVTDLTFSNISYSSATASITSTNGGGTIDHYEIQVWLNEKEVQRYNGTSKIFNLINLSPNTNYKIKAWSHNEKGWSNEYFKSLTTTQPTPGKPSIKSFSIIDAEKIELKCTASNEPDISGGTRKL
jgi:hypothetical protein